MIGKESEEGISAILNSENIDCYKWGWIGVWIQDDFVYWNKISRECGHCRYHARLVEFGSGEYVWSRHGYFGSTTSHQNTNYGLTNWPNIPLKRTKTLRLGIIIVMTLLNSIVCFFTPLYRATNGPGGWAIREAEGNPNRTEYVWLFDVDLKVITVSKSQIKVVQCWVYNEFF